MKERPIIFSGPMVRAILEGRKTQTRRIVKNIKFYDDRTVILAGKKTTITLPKGDSVVGWCPHGKPGDRLWVRETWAIMSKSRQSAWKGEAIPKHLMESVELVYRADEDYGPGIYRPSIHMPRWASRIDLEITDVRVERLQDITEEDAMAEGAYKSPAAGNYRMGFGEIWESINGSGSWSKNPWVWVIEFKRVGGDK